ncbi:hypothetical protein ACE6H2_007066 [Prunus campanulata]
MLQGNVLKHGGAEYTKFAYSKAMCLSKGVPKVSLGKKVPKVPKVSLGTKVPKVSLGMGVPEDVLRHEAAEGVKLACRKKKCVEGSQGESRLGNTEWLRMMIRGVPKGTEEWENDRSLLCQFPQTAPNC